MKKSKQIIYNIILPTHMLIKKINFPIIYYSLSPNQKFNIFFLQIEIYNKLDTKNHYYIRLYIANIEPKISKERHQTFTSYLFTFSYNLIIHFILGFKTSKKNLKTTINNVYIFCLFFRNLRHYHLI